MMHGQYAPYIVIVLFVDIILLGGPVWQGFSGPTGASAPDMSLGSSSNTWSWNCSSTNGFTYNESWNVAWYDAGWTIVNEPMVSNGNTVTFPSIGVGTGWHGPVYVHQLAIPFLLEDLVEFVINWSFTNDLVSYVGRYYVYLADSDQKPVVSFTANDFKADEYAGDYGAQYWFSNYTYYHHGTTYPYAFTEFNGTMNAHYEPDVGILSYVDGYSTGLITEVESGDLQREIRYVVVMGGRGADSALMPCYINGIEVLSGTPEPRFSLWHEKCEDTGRFSYDESWNVEWYGADWAIVDGSMRTVKGTFTFSGIGTGTGWHGPVYVHELTSNFDLEDLELFSVKWRIDNSDSSYLGIYCVYLADSNRDPVAVVQIDDWLPDAHAGSYSSQYHFSSGGVSILGSLPVPLDFTQFNGAIKIWYEAGNGIMGHCDGLRSALITEVGQQDLTREIEYVVIMGARYSSYSLMPAYIDDVSIIIRGTPDRNTTTTTTTTIPTTSTTTTTTTTIPTTSTTTTSTTTTPTTTATDTTTTTTTSGFQFDIVALTITGGSVLVIIVIVCMAMRNKPSGTQ